MQGTWHVRSLIRLFIGAALLCLAWVVLTSGQASAAERPAPTQPVSQLVGGLPLVDTDGLQGVLGSLVEKAPVPAERPADTAPRTTTSGSATKAKSAAQKRSGATTSAPRRSTPEPVATNPVDEVVRQVVPVLEQVDTAALATVDSGLALVTDVADATTELPLAGQPVSQLTDAVVGLVRTLPVVGVPAPIVPLPVGDGTPTDVLPVPVPGLLETLPSAPPVLLPAAADSLVTPRGGSQPVAVSGVARAESPTRTVTQAAPSDGRRPSAPGALVDPVPALPSQPSPTGGTTQGAGDPATVSTVLALPNPSFFGRSGADWRVPRGLPAHPGTRPD
jgi:hypothetical protein